MHVESPYLNLTFARTRPGFDAFAVDSLGKGKTQVNLLLPSTGGDGPWQSRRVGNAVEYRPADAGANAPWAWRIEVGGHGLTLESAYHPGQPAEPVVLRFDRLKSSATVLALFPPEELDGAPPMQTPAHFNMPDANCRMLLPAVLHLPDSGSLRITSTSAGTIDYDAKREHNASGFTRVSFLPATPECPEKTYQLEVAALYPAPERVPDDPVYDGFKRNVLNALQLNPRIKLFANSSAGGSGPFALYFYSAVAAQNIQLAEGLSTLDILRQTLERYLSGFITYGMTGYKNHMDFTDSFTSLLIAAADYALPSGDAAWLRRHFDTLVSWAERIRAQDRDGDGLIEYPLSGNSGSWPDKLVYRPANWWDTIGFGHKDAYGNALAYRAFSQMAAMSAMIDRKEEAQRFQSWADRIKELYVPTFLNPATGVLAGWKSEDGQLHDYYFLFLNSAAICYGLVPEDLAHDILDRLIAKMAEVGYDRFELGLPGNLVTVRRDDYVQEGLRWGGGERADNADGFQKYENGGATVCHAYFTIQACYRLKRWEDGDRMFAPMLKAFGEGAFQGLDETGFSRDWRSWDGTCYGYEALLADGYMTLLPVLERLRHPAPLRTLAPMASAL